MAELRLYFEDTASPGLPTSLTFVIGGKAEGFGGGAFGGPNTRLFATGASQSRVGIPQIPLWPTAIHSTVVGPIHAGTGIGRGFNTTTFGTPQNIPNAVGALVIKTGIPQIPLYFSSVGHSTNFGVALGYQFSRVTGTKFGEVGSSRLFPMHPVGFLSDASFGSGFTRGGHWQHHSNTPTTTLSPAYTAFDQTTSHAGASTTGTGTPYAMVYGITPAMNVLCYAVGGIYSGQVGLAACAYSQAGGVSGLTCSAVGAPRSVRGGHAAGFGDTLHGAARSRSTAHPAGMHSTDFGAALSANKQAAAGAYLAARFGAPQVLRSNTYTHYGINRTYRVGHPTGAVRINRTCSGISGTHVGAPASRERHKTVHIAPCMRAGTPLLRRIC